MAKSEHPVLRWVRESACVHTLEDARVVHVRGDDARTWLNGQTTNDVREVGEDAAVYALSVDVKGRVQADLWVTAERDGMAFVAPASQCDALLEAMERYIIMEDVELSSEPLLSVVTVQGPSAERVVAEVVCERRYATRRLGVGGFDLWLTADQRDAALRALQRSAEAADGGVADAEAWNAVHVAAAVPRFGIDFGPQTYPQEAGLEQRAVSFNKGCYLGQEVICMLENRGKLGRRLCALEAPAGATAAPGDPCSSVDGARVGHVTAFAELDRGRALAMLKRGHDEPTREVRIGDATWTVTTVVGADD